MKPWQAAAAVTAVVATTLVLLLVLDPPSGAGHAPSESEVAVTVTSLVIFVFGVLWLLFTVLRARRDRRDGAK